MFDRFARTGDLTAANDLLREMLGRRVFPNGYIFTALARTAEKADSESELNNIMRLLDVISYKPSIIEWTVIMRSFGGPFPSSHWSF